METIGTPSESARGALTVRTPVYLNARDVAKILDVTPKTVYTWAQTGQIPSVRIGRQVRFPLEEVITRGKENAQRQLVGVPS